MDKNPFPGPMPYRGSDRGRFFGRERVARTMESVILANRCVTVFGPSGAGKSSLLQAAVVPLLEDEHDYRTVRIDGWPAGQPPIEWIAHRLLSSLKLGEPAEGGAPDERVMAAVQRAMRRSDRPLLLYLDQIEQLLLPSRGLAGIDALVECLDELTKLPIRGLKLVLGVREDYLGRLRDRARDRWHLLDHGFRVGPLTVAELCDAVCKAAGQGDPPQAWYPEEMRALMLEVRTPGQLAIDEAEAQAAYAQIVCRALFQEQAHGECHREVARAEPILRRYLESTLEGLGPLAEPARLLLEDELISADGSRTLRTEKELEGALPPGALDPVLRALESAAVLRSQEHQGSRYFELGHDWLAKKLHEQKQERALAEERRRQELERREAEDRLRRVREVAVNFRTPLNDVIGYCELLIEEAQDAGNGATVADLQKIEGAGRKLVVLIDDILSVAGT
jgi:energy-coupling factor transporter ATP-binding protein EcfA2